eukprot:scaffold79988_cov63-Phaeocystis_antarctica.AAC.5
MTRSRPPCPSMTICKEDAHPCALHKVPLLGGTVHGEISVLHDALVIPPRVAMHGISADAEVGTRHPG